MNESPLQHDCVRGPYERGEEMPKPNLTMFFDHHEARANVLSRMILAEICVSETPRIFQ